jgi:hypothetical protein
MPPLTSVKSTVKAKVEQCRWSTPTVGSLPNQQIINKVYLLIELNKLKIYLIFILLIIIPVPLRKTYIIST